MSLEQRPNSRGGRAARRANQRELEADRLKALGALSNEDIQREQAWAEKLNCPICRQAVHPTNWSAHMALKHADKIIPLHEAEPGRLPLTAIRIDGGTQPRGAMNGNVVFEYAEKMQEGVQFPPIIVYYDGESYWLADGFHRMDAAKSAGLPDVAAEVRQGTQRDAILYSVGANETHGLRRTNDDKRRAVMRLLTDDEWTKWSDREIARQCAVSNRYVSNLRQGLTVNGSQLARTYTTKHGTPATMNTGNIGKSSPPVQYGKIEDDYQPEVPEVQVDGGETEVKDSDYYAKKLTETQWRSDTPEGKREAVLGGRGSKVQHIHSGQVGTLQFISGDIAYVDTDNGRKSYHSRYIKKFENPSSDAGQAGNASDKDRPKPSTSRAYMRGIYDSWRSDFKDDDLLLITQDGATYIAIGRDDGILRFKTDQLHAGFHIEAGHIGLSGGADHILVSKIDAALLHEIEQQYKGAVLAISYADLNQDMQYVTGTAFRARNIPLNIVPAQVDPPAVDLYARAQELGADATLIEGVNYKRDSKVTRAANEYEPQGYDACQTPAYAIDPLLQYLGWSMPSRIWEPARGEGLIVEALFDAGWTEEHVITSDILTGENFLKYEPDQPWDIIVTNPPYSLKFPWLERCYQLDKPFALLLPVEALAAAQTQALIERYGFEMMLLDNRVDFKMPNVGWDSHAQFGTFWLCHDLLPQKVMFGSIKAAKKAFKAEIGVEVDDDPE